MFAAGAGAVTRCLGVRAVMLLLLLPLFFGSSLNAFVSAASPRVALYMSESNSVLDLHWDDGPKNLERQLRQLGFEVTATTEQPQLSGDEAPSAYVIPAQNGPQYYSAAEDMSEIASYLVSRGGLVVLLDANHGQGSAASDFVAKALGYKGKWGVCKRLASNADNALGEPALTEFAASFMPSKAEEWPVTLEDAETVSFMSWCSHEDPDATTLPLYTAQDDANEVAVQVFGKAGTPGAVVWMGYNWKAGEQPQWGDLLAKLVNNFAAGSYIAPSEGNADLHSAQVESVLAAAADSAADAVEVVRRFLQVAIPPYPPPPFPPAPPAPPLPSPPPPSPLPPSPSPPPSPTPPSPEPPSPSPPSPPSPPTPPPSPPSPPTPPPTPPAPPSPPSPAPSPPSPEPPSPAPSPPLPPSPRPPFPNPPPSPPPLPPGKGLLKDNVTLGWNTVPLEAQIDLNFFLFQIRASIAAAENVPIALVFIAFVQFPDGSFIYFADAVFTRVTRRAALEAAAEKVFTPREIKEIFADMPGAPNVMYYMGSSPVNDGDLPEAQANHIVNEEALRRVLQQTRADGTPFGFNVGYTIFRVISVPFPPSPPPSPPLLPGQFAPPGSPPLPPAPPPSPPSPPPLPLSVITGATGAEQAVDGFHPPSPSPPPDPPTPPSPAPPPSPRPPSPLPPSPPPPSPAPANVPPPSRPPSPPLPPPPPPPSYINLTNSTAWGAAGTNRALVWYDDPDFQSQLINNSPLYLVDQNKPNCSSRCAACNYAWKATRNQLSVAVFFKDPFQVTRVFLKQIRNSGVILVQLIKWVYPPQGVIEGNLGRTVWNVSDDTSMCQSVLVVRIGPKRSGINRPVPPNGNQESLPPKLAPYAVGGLLITMEQPSNAGPNFGPFLEWVRVNGRVLYPRNPAIYAPYTRRKK